MGGRKLENLRINSGTNIKMPIFEFLSAHPPIRPKFYIHPPDTPLSPNSKRRQLPGLDYFIERIFPDGQ